MFSYKYFYLFYLIPNYHLPIIKSKQAILVSVLAHLPVNVFYWHSVYLFLFFVSNKALLSRFRKSFSGVIKSFQDYTNINYQISNPDISFHASLKRERHLKNISLPSSPSEKENTQAKVECVEGMGEGGKGEWKGVEGCASIFPFPAFFLALFGFSFFYPTILEILFRRQSFPLSFFLFCCLLFFFYLLK